MAGPPVRLAVQVAGRPPDDRRDLLDGADRRGPRKGDLHPSRRPERVPRQRHHARGLHPGADRPDAQRGRGPAQGSSGGSATCSPPAARLAGGKEVKGEGNVTKGTIYVRLEDLEERKTPSPSSRSRTRRGRSSKTSPTSGPASTTSRLFQGGNRSQTFQVNLAGPDLEKLAIYADRLIAEPEAAPGGITDLDTTLSLRKPEIQVAVDRERGQRPGHPRRHDRRHAFGSSSAADRSRGSRTAASSTTSGSAPGRATATRRRNVANLSLPSTKAGLVKLTSLAQLSEEKGPTEIERYGRERIVTVLGNPESIQLGEAVERATAILDGDGMPPGLSLRLQRPGQDDGRDGLLVSWSRSASR